jgi:dTDP-4-amino-4,6-dideoxygalactose transaminase
VSAFIPFNRPCRTGREERYMSEALDSGHISGDGAFTKKCHALLNEALGSAGVLLTTSCTHALEMAALLLDLEPGDEVVIPSFTFVSTANAFALHGARPVFVDVRPDTLNLDEQLLEKAISPRTRAVVPVHYAGVGCAMDTILEIAGRHGAMVVEDNAHGLFGSYRGRPLGSFGRLSTLSFHETKNFNCGEGGALVLNDASLLERAEIVREKGTNRSRFFRGQVDKYTWVDFGSSFLPSDLLAAYLFAQLEAREAVIAKRRAIFEFYSSAFGVWAGEHGVRLPVVPAECGPSFHMFYLLLPSLRVRQALIEHLKAAGILAVFHYQPLHLSPMGVKFGGKKGDCPVTEDVSDRLLRLPFYNDLSASDLDRVASALTSFSGW